MFKNKYFRIVINILFIVCVIVFINILYRYFIEKNIYKNIDFLTFSIKDIKDYNVVKNCTENYLFACKYGDYNVGYFLHNKNEEKNKKYSEYLSKETINIEIINAKKSIGKLYVVYYKINSQSDVVNRIVFKINGKKYQVLYDSMYESFEVE